MHMRLATLVGVVLTVAALDVAAAENAPPTPIPGHPAATSPGKNAAAPRDPFALAVPLLDRAAPTPTFGRTPPSSGGNAAPAMEMPMGTMDHSNMPGMTDGSH